MRTTKRHAESVCRQAQKLEFLELCALNPNRANPRKHDTQQVRAIARSIESFGFNAPILIDKRRNIVTGHGRYAAAKLLGLERVPTSSVPLLNTWRAAVQKKRRDKSW
jgi:ParB-like chromosome segregation protein Spo0J